MPEIYQTASAFGVREKFEERTGVRNNQITLGTFGHAQGGEERAKLFLIALDAIPACRRLLDTVDAMQGAIPAPLKPHVEAIRKAMEV